MQSEISESHLTSFQGSSGKKKNKKKLLPFFHNTWTILSQLPMWIVLNYIGNKTNPMAILHGQTKQTNKESSKNLSPKK
jgi:hypothetical protein